MRFVGCCLWGMCAVGAVAISMVDGCCCVWLNFVFFALYSVWVFGNFLGGGIGDYFRSAGCLWLWCAIYVACFYSWTQWLY